ncbi:hypothetical protein IWQ49_006466 [Labrenzia sp. EL_126]|nr:hypothetical protein [Labrenzia sp. EL_126]
MANRQSRDPGTFRNVQSTARVGGVPSFAVDTGDASRALANVAGSLSGRLKGLADKAKIREAELAGLSAGERGAVSYLQARSAEQAAPTSAGGRPSRGQVNAPADIRNEIVAAAQRHGMDPAKLMKIAELESSFNPGAKNKRSSAGGLFQFIDGTAADYGLKNRFDPAEASDAGARLMRDNRAHLVKVLGREPTVGELYLAHQQGRGGAAKLLANPDAKAVDIVGVDAVILNGGKKSWTAAQFAGLWLRKAGDTPGEVRSGLPELNTQPLALRRDGSMSGDAFDRAAMRSYTWRMSEGLSTDLANAYQDFGDDPTAFADRMEEIQANYLQDPNMRDPEIREAFQKNFSRQSRGYRMKVASQQETLLRQEEVAAAEGAIDARERDLERQAHALGANGDGDQILAEHLQQSQQMVDAAVEAGTLSPLQGQRKKEKLAKVATRGRVQGVFDALETPAQKEQFALSLLEDWQAGEGPLAQLDYATVKSLSQSLYRDARALGNKQDADARLQKGKLKDLLQDDIASIEKTGRPIDLEAAGFSEEAIAASLTPEENQAWQDSREIAGEIYDAVVDMDMLPADDIEARLDGLEPEPGAPGFRDQEAILAAAEKKAKEVLTLRSKDPARAVEETFDQVAELAELADPENPETMIALVNGRLDAQRALDIPELGQMPLTLVEATDLARAIMSGDAKGQADATRELVGQVQGAYGPHAGKVLTQVLQVRGVDRELADYGSALFIKLARQERPSAGELRQAGVNQEIGAAEASFNSGVTPGTQPVPSYEAIQLLIAQPELAPQFDEKYGKGYAARLLDGQLEDPHRRKVEGGVEFVDGTGEGFIPDE